ncbi:STAS domain-containing protein [Desulfohalovibrio reitneri]|uniref:STAS domain-containing protein n=1 Tax=Desulfohalovibrio reitneri TaxID=1307759 RepID=UPI0004A766FF|nr:STAS domain-containing protein [Desulfohalovibrio reitneri]
MGGYTLESGEGATRLLLDGDFGVQDSDELRSVLHDALVGGDGLAVDLSGVGRVDLTFFQLLESAAKTAGNMGKAYSLESPSGDVLDEAKRHGIAGGGCQISKMLGG